MEWKSICMLLFFEDDDNIFCLQLAETDGTFPPSSTQNTDTVSYARESSRKDFTRHLGFLLGESTRAPLPAHALRLPFQRGPALFINRLFVPLSWRCVAE